MKETFCESCGEIVTNGFIVNSLTSKYCQECSDIIRNCSHDCTSNCRREGCNCDCGEYHIILN